MGPARVVPPVLWALAVGLIVDSILRGGASVWLLVVVPVVTGQSLEFLVGVALLLAGFLTLPWLFLEEEPEPSRGAAPPPSSSRAEPPSAAGGAGGVILVGPVPILFGSWGRISQRTKW